MADSIVICFKDDSHQVSIPKNIINQYPNSAIYGYLELSDTNTITLEDIFYADFCIVAQALNKQLKQWQVPSNILAYMDRNGLVDDNIHRVQTQLISKLDKTLEHIDNFINGINEPLMIIWDTDTYQTMKSILKGNINFVSVQVTALHSEIICIHISELLPIYTCRKTNAGKITKKVSGKTEIIDLFGTRERLFYSDDIPTEERYGHAKGGGKESLYSLDMFQYLGEIHNIIPEMCSYKKMFVRNKRTGRQYYNFRDYFNDASCEDLKNALDKIIEHISKINVVSLTAESSDINIQINKTTIDNYFSKESPQTFFGFINLNSLLKKN